jgi:PKHD-type hydroxylase
MNDRYEYKFGEEQNQVDEELARIHNMPPYVDVAIVQAFEKSEVKSLIKLCESYEIIDASIGQNYHDKHRRRTKIAWIPLPHRDKQTKWLYDRMQQAALEANKKYFNFDLKGAQPMQYGVYEADDRDTYCTHVDMSHHDKENIRKLSISIPLSDPDEYEGGSLLINPSTNECLSIAQKPGTAICFPSWTPHMVTQVTKGVRRSLVMWCYGPKFV